MVDEIYIIISIMIPVFTALSGLIIWQNRKIESYLNYIEESRILFNKIENICNNKRVNFIEEWQKKNEKDPMIEFGLSITYTDGIKEISPQYTLTEPEEINVYIIVGEKSKGNNGQAAMEIGPLDKDFKKWFLNVYLDVMDYSNDTLRWTGFEVSIPEIVYHELLHACDDNRWNNKHDGILRHNLIGINSVKEADNNWE